MSHTKLVNGKRVELTQAEIDEYNQREQDWQAQKPERLKQQYAELVMSMLKEKAQEKDYDDEQSIMSYLSSTNVQWEAEAIAFNAWRDELWAFAYQALADFELGNIDPDAFDFKANAPVMVWP